MNEDLSRIIGICICVVAGLIAICGINYSSGYFDSQKYQACIAKAVDVKDCKQ